MGLIILWCALSLFAIAYKGLGIRILNVRSGLSRL